MLSNNSNSLDYYFYYYCEDDSSHIHSFTCVIFVKRTNSSTCKSLLSQQVLQEDCQFISKYFKDDDDDVKYGKNFKSQFSTTKNKATQQKVVKFYHSFQCSSTDVCCTFLNCEDGRCLDKSVLVQGTETLGYVEGAEGLNNRFNENDNSSFTLSTTTTARTSCMNIGDRVRPINFSVKFELKIYLHFFVCSARQTEIVVHH
jgi:hypothetical protein